MKELKPLDQYIEDENNKLCGKSKAMGSVAKRLKTTVATLYRWVHCGSYYIHYDDDLSMAVVYRSVKHVELNEAQ